MMAAQSSEVKMGGFWHNLSIPQIVFIVWKSKLKFLSILIILKFIFEIIAAMHKIDVIARLKCHKLSIRKNLYWQLHTYSKEY
jgi:hypothetical protein